MKVLKCEIIGRDYNNEEETLTVWTTNFGLLYNTPAGDFVTVNSIKAIKDSACIVDTDEEEVDDNVRKCFNLIGKFVRLEYPDDITAYVKIEGVFTTKVGVLLRGMHFAHLRPLYIPYEHVKGVCELEELPVINKKGNNNE